eukprot:5419941-Amphidinium_carterae.2
MQVGIGSELIYIVLSTTGANKEEPNTRRQQVAINSRHKFGSSLFTLSSGRCVLEMKVGILLGVEGWQRATCEPAGLLLLARRSEMVALHRSVASMQAVVRMAPAGGAVNQQGVGVECSADETLTRHARAGVPATSAYH